MNILYQYLACSVRNSLEVWDSDLFLCPKQDHKGTASAAGVEEAHAEKAVVEGVSSAETCSPDHQEDGRPPQGSSLSATTQNERKVSTATTTPSQASNKWNQLDIDQWPFSLLRPTKLVDGSSGWQAFICEPLQPEEGHEYSIDDQARMQLISVLLVAASLIQDKHVENWRSVFKTDFQIDTALGIIFQRLFVALSALQVLALFFIISIIYALFRGNIYGTATPYVIQICSFCSWSVGATGLLMLGGTQRVKMSSRPIPEYIKRRMFDVDDAEKGPTFRNMSEDGNIVLNFGSLHDSVNEGGVGTCELRAHIVEQICGLDLNLHRTTAWYFGMVWFVLFMGVGVVLQFTGSTVITTGSQSMSVVFIISTSLARGAGISGPEDWMIPKWKMRRIASYAAPLLGQMVSRV